MGTDKRTRKKENRRQRLDELAKTDQKRKVRKNIIRALTVVGVIVGVVVIIRVSGGTAGELVRANRHQGCCRFGSRHHRADP